MKITFIVPTIGRKSLSRTIESIKNIESVEGWEHDAIVVFDGIEPTVSGDDEKIRVIRTPNKEGEQGEVHGCAGLVRNFGIRHSSGDWIGFVDDDDILLEKYIHALSKCPTDSDVVIFRMVYADTGLILPPPGATNFMCTGVGISFCVRKRLFTKEGFWFEQCGLEDFMLLDKLRSAGKKIHMSEEIVYVVKPSV